MSVAVPWCAKRPPYVLPFPCATVCARVRPCALPCVLPYRPNYDTANDTPNNTPNDTRNRPIYRQLQRINDTESDTVCSTESSTPIYNNNNINISIVCVRVSAVSSPAIKSRFLLADVAPMGRFRASLPSLRSGRSHARQHPATVSTPAALLAFVAGCRKKVAKRLVVSEKVYTFVPVINQHQYD